MGDAHLSAGLEQGPGAQGQSLDSNAEDTPDALTLAEKIPDADPDPEEAFLRRLDTSALWSAVEGLPAIQADVLRRYYERGETFAEIGLPGNHHKSWAKRIHDSGVKRLRSVMAEV